MQEIQDQYPKLALHSDQRLYRYQMKQVEKIYLHYYIIAWHPLCLSLDVFVLPMEKEFGPPPKKNV